MREAETDIQWVVVSSESHTKAHTHSNAGAFSETVANSKAGEEEIGVQVESYKKKLGGATGKGWKPGQSGNPKGAPSRRQDREMIEALKRALPPDKLEYWVNRALELAESQNSARGIINVLSFSMAYGLGKPVAATIPKGEKSALIEALLADDAPVLPESADSDSTDVL